jgi:hypothetical protein
MQDWEPLSARELSQELRVDDRALLDQDDEAIGANNGHHQTRPVGPVGANSGSRGRGLVNQIACAVRRDGASLWKSRFAKAIDIHLSLPLTATGYIFRFSKNQSQGAGPPPSWLLHLALDAPELPRGSDKPPYKSGSG